MGIIKLPKEITHEWILQYEKELKRLLKKKYIVPAGKDLKDHYITYTQCEITIRDVRISYSEKYKFFWVCLYIRPKDCKGEIIDYNKKIEPIGKNIDINGFASIIYKILSFVEFRGLATRILIYSDSNEWYRSNSHYKNDRIDY